MNKKTSVKDPGAYPRGARQPDAREQGQEGGLGRKVNWPGAIKNEL